jgi:hypothetical protein
VRYILLHDDVYRSQGEQPPPIPTGMHLVARLPGVRALMLNSDVKAADLPTVLRENAASIALVQGLPAPHVSTSGINDGTLQRDAQLKLTWDDPGLAYLQFLVHASAPKGARTLQLLDTSGHVIAQGTVGTEDTQLVLGPTGVSGLSASYTLRAEPAGDVKITSLQAQPVANVTKSIRDIH